MIKVFAYACWYFVVVPGALYLVTWVAFPGAMTSELISEKECAVQNQANEQALIWLRKHYPTAPVSVDCSNERSVWGYNAEQRVRCDAHVGGKSMALECAINAQQCPQRNKTVCQRCATFFVQAYAKK